MIFATFEKIENQGSELGANLIFKTLSGKVLLKMRPIHSAFKVVKQC
jgi:hypothetical protein